jgi:hypothetical protein
MRQKSLKVITNQLGYRNGHGKKRVLVPDVPEARGLFGVPVFWVMEQNEFSKHLLNSEAQPEYTYRAALNREYTDFGTWLTGDISGLTGDGIYQVFVGSNMGPTFAIRDDVYCRIYPECIRYFVVQSCGRKVPGWHDTCHLDDGYIVEDDRYIEAAGGWHDAGDFRKWATSTAMIPMSLLIGNRIWKGREEELGLASGIFLSEAMHGFEYFLNIQQSDGSVLQNVGGGRHSTHDNDDCRYTDNIKQSGDERRIHGGHAIPPGKLTLLYALYAEELKDVDS